MLFGLTGLPLAGELHGDMTQAARLESLERFRKVGGQLPPCLVCILLLLFPRLSSIRP